MRRLTVEQESTVTESEWATSTDPLAMLSFLRDLGLVSERKLRLFAVACCRRIRFDEARNGIKAVDAAELFADGRITPHRLHEAWIAVRHPKWFATGSGGRAVRAACSPPGTDPCAHVAADAVEAAVGKFDPRELPVLREKERCVQAALVRDIFGNPSRPISFPPEWRTEAVVALARGIYEERAFDRMPALADALEDAGCSDEVVLSHCRRGGTHVRGCWLVDEVLQRV
ncbi:MAG: hypothetical protein U0804_12575 [Gemmataceae bacterium]